MTARGTPSDPAPSDLAPSDPGSPSPVTDSPWFWAYLFASGGLVALFLAGPRYVDRQPQIERQFKARQEGGQVVAGENGPIAPSTSERMILPLTPLYMVLAVLLCLAWAGLWYQRFRFRRTQVAAARQRAGDAASPPES